MSSSELWVPRQGLEPVRLELGDNLRPFNYLRERLGEGEAPLSPLARWLRSLGMAGGKFDYLEEKDLGHNMGKTSFTMPGTVAIALCTAVPEDNKTGATITEANYTGYARKAVTGAQLTISGTNPTKIATNEKLEFAACTAGTSTVIGYAILDSSTTGAGNGLYWSTCTSTVISATQTPATIASGGLEVTED